MGRSSRISRRTLWIAVLVTNGLIMQICLLSVSFQEPSPWAPRSIPPDHKRLAFADSYGFFTDIRNTDWIQYHRQPLWEAAHSQKSYSDDLVQDSDSVARWTFFHWEPIFHCPRVRLFSVDRWVCDPDGIGQSARRDNRPCVILSFVLSLQTNSLLWLDQLLESVLHTNCHVHIFSQNSDDGGLRPTTLSQNKHYYHHHHWNPWNSTDSRFPRSVLSLSELQSKFGSIDVLYMDCEGCEWDVLPQWLNENITSVSKTLRQVVVETHALPHPTERRMYKERELGRRHANEMFQLLWANNFILFAKHVNSGTGDGCLRTTWSFLGLHPRAIGRTSHRSL